MNADLPLIIDISYDPDQVRGTFSLSEESGSAVWDRVRQAASAATEEYWLSPKAISVPWPAALTLRDVFSASYAAPATFLVAARPPHAACNALRTAFGARSMTRR